MKAKFKLLCLFCLVSAFSFAQQITVTGEVTSGEDNMPLPGVNVIVVGTTTGTNTDFDGKYTLNVDPGAVLEFSSLGFKTFSVTVNSQTTINVTMEPDVEALGEIVVVGYGTQRKADLTGAISTVQAEDIEKTPNSNVMQSLQGKVPGVQIVSNGSPGDSPTVRLRGVNSYAAGNNPLYVVDGQWYDNIDFLDPSQIESISALKDVSSIGIFGQRGVNGVIVIETKGGKFEQAPTITYNGYTGVQQAQNVLKMANTEQFATMVYESGNETHIELFENAIERFGRSRINPNLPDVNTDWYREILRPATIQNHSINVVGGSESVTYGAGTSYFGQEGILDMKNEYERFNINANVDVKVTDRLKIGVNSIFSNATKYNPENAAWFQAYFAVPHLPVFDYVNTQATSTPYSDAMLLDYRNSQNPFPVMRYNENQLRVRKMLASIYAEYFIVPEKLSFKTSYYHDFSHISARIVRLPYFISDTSKRLPNETSIRREENTYSSQMWDNVLTYKDQFGSHNLTLIAGSNFRDNSVNELNATGLDIEGIGLETSWYLDFADPTSFSDRVNESGSRLYSLAYFGRLEYNFNDRYLLNATVRHEGDGRFPKEIWKTTAQFGLGWVISEESFFPEDSFIDFLKVRGSYGTLANGALGGSSGFRSISQITVDLGDMLTNGLISTNNYQDLVREILVETNFGISARMFDSRLSLEADYFIRDTEDLVVPIVQPIVGNTILTNAGEMRNQGLEVAVNWSQTVSDNWSFNIGANIGTLKNAVTKIDSEQGYFDTGQAEFRQRLMVGEPVNAFFGLDVAGVYQNEAEITADPVAVANGLIPGDFRYVDQNGDGEITDADRVILGSYLPSLTYGGNLGVSYKNFDFSLAFYGQSGNQLLNRKRGEIIYTNDTNIDADFATNRWHGEGTTNSYPSAAGRLKPWNQRMSSFFVEDASFFRIQNIQLAYTIPAASLLGKRMPETKITFTAERPFTFFNYNGFNPEVANNGVDREVYPVPAIYTVGLNIKI